MSQVNSRLDFRLVAVAVALVFLLSVPGSVHAGGCSATGKFAFTIGAGAGQLVLSADGSALMNLLPDHLFCEACLNGLRRLIGSYRTGDIGDGQCGFTLDLREADGSVITILGVVAFQGSVLFQAATVPKFGPGLALRTDTLTGQ